MSLTSCWLLWLTEKLKLGLSIETKAWRDTYGKYCNLKYKQEMENIFDFIDDVNKRLQRPIKDLDDIRYAMQALREIRENEIRIDMQISPIEVSRPVSTCGCRFGGTCVHLLAKYYLIVPNS